MATAGLETYSHTNVIRIRDGIKGSVRMSVIFVPIRVKIVTAYCHCYITGLRGNKVEKLLFSSHRK